MAAWPALRFRSCSITSGAAWSTLPGGRRIASLWLRGLIVVLLVLALAGLSLVRPTRELFVVFAVDRSESVGEKGIEAVDAFLDQGVFPRRQQSVRGASVRVRARNSRVRLARVGGDQAARSRRRHRRVKQAGNGPADADPTPPGSTARAPTWPRRSRWPRRPCLRFTFRASWFSLTEMPPRAMRFRPRTLRGKVQVLIGSAAGSHRARSAALRR